MKNIEENNELIAKFIGYSQPHPDYPNTTYWYKDGEEPLAILLFHVDWNWLMNVLKELDNLEFELPEDSNLIGDITHGLVSLDIEMTYEAVVEFIRWYNEDK